MPDRMPTSRGSQVVPLDSLHRPLPEDIDAWPQSELKSSTSRASWAANSIANPPSHRTGRASRCIERTLSER